MPVRYDKLVRDRIPEIIQAQGQHPVTRILDNASYQEALLAKLAEETREAQEAAAEDLPDELADIVEVIQALATAVSSTPNAESGVGRGPDCGVGVEARIGRYGAAISGRLSPARISASYAPASASTIDSTASKGARSAPSRWCRPARNPGEL
jgi:predicted house-cleaning noncanonical NTP pyrophosphatase (MazG superfamily)